MLGFIEGVKLKMRTFLCVKTRHQRLIGIILLLKDRRHQILLEQKYSRNIQLITHGTLKKNIPLTFPNI